MHVSHSAVTRISLNGVTRFFDLKKGLIPSRDVPAAGLHASSGFLHIGKMVYHVFPIFRIVQ
jgi:hypothetical protein